MLLAESTRLLSFSISYSTLHEYASITIHPGYYILDWLVFSFIFMYWSILIQKVSFFLASPKFSPIIITEWYKFISNSWYFFSSVRWRFHEMLSTLFSILHLYFEHVPVIITLWNSSLKNLFFCENIYRTSLLGFLNLYLGTLLLVLPIQSFAFDHKLFQEQLAFLQLFGLQFTFYRKICWPECRCRFLVVSYWILYYFMKKQTPIFTMSFHFDHFINQ